MCKNVGLCLCVCFSVCICVCVCLCVSVCVDAGRGRTDEGGEEEVEGQGYPGVWGSLKEKDSCHFFFPNTIFFPSIIFFPPPLSFLSVFLLVFL